MDQNAIRKNRISLLIEIVLTISICFGIAWNSFASVSKQCANFEAEIMTDYQILTQNYIRSFEVLRMEAVEKIEEDLSFEEMSEWLQSKDAAYTAAVGADVYDGFAFTYKGGYVHSWNYGDYSDYDPNTRPWYQTAQSYDGEVAVVAPYVTFLSNTDLIDEYDILRMSIVQKYDDEISFDFDLNVKEINNLLAGRKTVYSGTVGFLYDKDGYILSSTDDAYYGHNINTVDEKITQSLSDTLMLRSQDRDGVHIHFVDGSARLVYVYNDEEGKTLTMMVPGGEVFVKNFLFILLLACALIVFEVRFYKRNAAHLVRLEENRETLKKNYQELEKANKAKSEFLSRMSHELRTPLNALSGYSTLMRENIQSGELDQELLLQNLTNNDRATRYLLRIIDDILDIQNVEFGRIHIQKEFTDLESSIENIIEVISQEAEQKKLHFTYERQSAEGVRILADAVRMQQVMLNILHNAIKFTAEGGEVHLTTTLVMESEEQARIGFSVTDTGIGMTEEFIRERLFQKFAQENADLTSPYEGCGIGLTISKQIIELMGGTITCISEKGKGTTFTVELPVEYKKKRRRKAACEKITYDLSGLRVLLCEDNPMNQDMERKVLTRMGCEVDIADDGEIGLEKFKASEVGYYSIILMDIRMPVMDGLEATKCIRIQNRPDAKSIPIFAVSANAFEEDVQQSLAAGMNLHLAKPVDARLLFSKIEEYCKKSTQ